MKKFLKSALLCAVLTVSATGLASCKRGTGNSYSVYAPDGAPALALTYALSQGGDDFSYHVIDASTVQAQVTGSNPNADFCILPLNLASKLLGDGQTYRMLGTVTNGNIYFLTTGENPALTTENMKEALTGKTVGVVQLVNVPGLTLQVVMKDLGVDYQMIESVQAEKSESKVNLVAIADPATGVAPSGGCDYYLCPEPLFTTKIEKTAATANPMRAAGDLQSLYGGENGYPQAVLVVKNSVIEGDKKAVKTLTERIRESGNYLKEADASKVLSLLDAVRTEGLTPAFTQSNLNADVIENCSVRFTAASENKTAVNAFLQKLIAVNQTSAAEVSDAFYYAE